MNTKSRRACVALLGAITLLAGAAFAVKKSEKQGYWSIRVQYPRWQSSGKVAERANSLSRTLESSDYNSFVHLAKKDVPELKKLGSSARYALSVDGTVSMDAPQLCSGYVLREQYTGGANAMRNFRTLNLANVNGSVRSLGLGDLFRKGSPYIGEASSAVIRELKRQTQPPSGISSGSVRALFSADLSKFVVTRTGILFLFDKGQIASNAEGIFKAMVPFSALPNLDRQGALKPVFASASTTSLTGGRWNLASIQYNDDRTFKPAPSEACWVEFANGKVSGRAGANRFNGPYTVSSDRQITVGPLAMTRAANPPGTMSEAFEKDISQVKSYFFKDSRLIMELPYDTGSLIFTR